MKCWRFPLIVVLLAGTLACTAPPVERGQDPFAGYRIVDLTHAFDEQTVYWPTGQPFQHVRTAWGLQPGGYFYSSYDLAMSEHTGTHLDAPIHFSEGQETVGNVTLDRLTGPLAVVDIRNQCEESRDYAAAASDLEDHEADFGEIEPGMIVIFRTDWSNRWPNTLAYLGDDTVGSASDLHFPGVSTEAAQWLVDRGISAVGIDTASIDTGNSTDFKSHQILAGNSIPVLENVASLEEVPDRGAFLLAFPMRIGRGSGAPCRIAALVPVP
ncbi:MAG: cyclase family protein [Bryobacterales bacterium]|nr:cyclase family protein [Bryobacterales bacterium]